MTRAIVMLRRLMVIAMNINYQEFNPSPALANAVDAYWCIACDGDPSEWSPPQSCLPHGMAELIIHLRGRSREYMNGEWFPFPEYYLVGIMEKPVVWTMAGQTALFGIRLKPEGWIQAHHSHLAGVANSFVDAAAFFGPSILSDLQAVREATDHATRIALLEFFLQKQQSPRPAANLHLTMAVQLIQSGALTLSVDELSRAVCISERQLQRVFKENFGIGPKAYIRIMRFRKICQLLRNYPTLSSLDIAYHFGYADQAHFIRDFKIFSGKTPKQAVLN